MRVRLERALAFDHYSVYFFDGGDGMPHRQWFPTAKGWTWEEFDPTGERRGPSLTLQPEMLEALIAEGSNLLPPDRSQARHLDDAIKVRDRLMDTLLPKGS